MLQDLIIIIGIIFFAYKLITHEGKLTLARIIAMLGMAIWIGLGFFRLLLCLPYPVLVFIGKGLGKIFAALGFGKRRIRIARRNLELCFPHYSETEIDRLIDQNIESVGMAIIETGMAWFWSDKRILKWSRIEGLEYLKNQPEGTGIIFVGVHFLTLELGARIVGLQCGHHFQQIDCRQLTLIYWHQDLKGVKLSQHH